MIRWILSAALCLFLTEGSHPALAQKVDGAGGGRAGVSSSRDADPAAVKGGKGSKSGAAAKPAPSRPGGGLKNSSNAKSDSGRATNLAPVTRDRYGSSSGGGKKPGRPGDDGQPGRPGGDGQQPGRPGGDGHRPGGWEHSGRPGGQPHRPWRDRCDPYCYGPTWFGYYHDDFSEAEYRREKAVNEPLTYFSPGQFEFYADPRLDWAAEGGLGSTSASPPPPGAKPVSPAAKSQSETELRQYEQMMRVWR